MPGRQQPHLSFLIELVAVLWRRAMTPFRILWRRSWFYRQSLRGRMPGRIVRHPTDFGPRRLEDADALLRGRFRFAGESVDIRQGTIFDAPPPSAAWQEALHGFVWLAPLAAAGGEPARVLATNLIGQWLRRHARYSEPAWRADILARRLVNLFAHSRFVFAKSDVMWRSRLLVSLREQSRILARISQEAPDGLPRLKAACVHALSGLCLDDSQLRLSTGLERLAEELERQVLPDGGHVSRSPEALLEAYRQLAMLNETLIASGRALPPDVQNARERMAPMLRFFRLGDGGLALFNGGREAEPRAIANLLARDEVRGQPFAFAPNSGYQRVVAGRSTVVMDCGAFPPGAFSCTAHAACLAFELSTGNQRIVVNCGAAPNDPKWAAVLRNTAAHSTVTLGDRSVGKVLNGRLARLLGPRLSGGPTTVTTGRKEMAEGWAVNAAHDGYLAPFGMMHERRLLLSSNGRLLSGQDRLVPRARRSREAIPFAARFHIHPDVRVSASQGSGVLLKLASGDGWRFQAEGAELSIEKSIYLGGDVMRRSEQLVLSGMVRGEAVDLAWSFERIGI